MPKKPWKPEHLKKAALCLTVSHQARDALSAAVRPGVKELNNMSKLADIALRAVYGHDGDDSGGADSGDSGSSTGSSGGSSDGGVGSTEVGGGPGDVEGQA